MSACQDGYHLGLSNVGDFFQGRSVFITGATGFMGKVLVEKLLRSTPVDKLYLLIRPKKGEKAEARLKDMLKCKIFDKLQSCGCPLEDRIQAVSGDISQPGFGLSQEDHRLLTEEVSVVFHNAATVKFNEPLKTAMAINVGAVVTVLELAREMVNLTALVHVSTAYCNTHIARLPEEIVDNTSLGDPKGLITLCQSMESSVLDSITPALIGDRPNTYCYTKALGESALQLYGEGLPIAIVRPSMVVAAWREPIPGWTEKGNGPSMTNAGIGTGLMRTAFGKRDGVTDFIPVDIPINMMIATAWSLASCPRDTTIPVYNCTSGCRNPVTWAGVESLVLSSLHQFPFLHTFRSPTACMTASYTLNRLQQVFLQALPASLADLAALAAGRKGGAARTTSQIRQAQQLIAFFTTHSWHFEDRNTDLLQAQLDKGDRDTFNLDMASMSWPEFVDDWVKGTRLYIMGDPLTSLPAARTRLAVIFWTETFIQVVLLGLLMWLLRGLFM